MIFLPVAEREAREACRQRWTYLWRWIIAALALVIMAFVYFLMRSGGGGGSELFAIVATVAFLYCLFGGALRTSDTIAEEKRENTLGLLFLTDLKTGDILLGKLLTSSVNCVFGLVAMIPILAVPMLMGGVSGDEFWKVILALSNTLFLSISWGFFISAIFRTGAATVAAASLVALFWAAGIALLSGFFEEIIHARGLSKTIFLFSPIDQLVSAFKNRPQFWPSVFVNHALAWAHLGLALFFLPRLWQEVPKNKRTERFRQRMREWRFGKAEAKKKFRARLLGQNPIFWLANRERISSGGLLILITVILGGALLIGASIMNGRPGQIDEMAILFMVSLLIAHAFIAFRVAGAATYRLAEDRKSGGLELILATSISIREVLRGQWKALGRQFFGPVLIVQLGHFFALGLILLMWMRHQSHVTSVWDAFWLVMRNPLDFSGPANGLGMVILMAMSIALGLSLNWMPLGWVGMWLGLRFKRPAVALWTTLILVFVPPPALFIGTMITIVESGAMRNMSEQVAIPLFFTYAWILWLTNIILLTRWARRKVYARFREAASDRFSSTKFSVPWQGLRRFAVRAAVVLLCLWGAYAIFRAQVNRSGERAWALAQAKHKSFGLGPKAGPVAAARENLPEAPTLLLLQGANYNANPNPNLTSLWLFFPHNAGDLPWRWTAGEHANFDGLAKAFLEHRVVASTSSTPTDTVIDGFTRRYGVVLDKLHEEAADRPRMVVKRDSSPYPNRWFDYSQNNFQVAISLLANRATARLQGERDGALEDIHLGLRIAEGLRDDPRRLSSACEATLTMVQPIYEYITSGKGTDSDLLRIQNHFAKIDVIPLLNAAREDWIRQQLAAGEQIVRDRSGGSFLASRLPIGFIRQDQAKLLDFGQNQLANCINVTNKTISLEAAAAILPTHPKTYADEHGAFEAFRNTIRVAAFLQTTANQIVLACALERYKLNHHAYPDTLAKLYPRFVGEMPNDIFTGKPLMYRRNRTGYEIWSAGWDGKDQNAKRLANVLNGYALWQDELTGDWVWISR